MLGEGGSCGVLANEYSCTQVPKYQINFEDLTPYLNYAAYEAMFRIREILVIRILGSIHLIADPDPALSLVDSYFQDANKKVFLKFFLLFTFP
jgi:hypothetical protein